MEYDEEGESLNVLTFDQIKGIRKASLRQEVHTAASTHAEQG